MNVSLDHDCCTYCFVLCRPEQFYVCEPPELANETINATAEIGYCTRVCVIIDWLPDPSFPLYVEAYGKGTVWGPNRGCVVVVVYR